MAFPYGDGKEISNWLPRSNFNAFSNLGEDELAACFEEGVFRKFVVHNDVGEGVEVYADDFFAAEQVSSLCGVVEAHGEIVADREHDKVKFELFAPDFHVGSQGSVTCEVECPFDRIDNESSWIAAIGSVGETAAVHGIHVFDRTEFEFPLAAMVHWVAFCNALILQPCDNLIVGNAGRARLLGQGHGIRNMVSMRMRDQDVVGLDVGQLNMAGKWISGNKRVKQQGFA